MIHIQTLTRQEETMSAPSGLLQKIGGIAALLLGIFYAAFLALFLLVLPALGFDPGMFRDPPRFVAFVLAHYSIYYPAALVGVVITPAIVVLVRALDERMHATTASPSLIEVATAFGYIGATILFLNWLFQYTGISAFASAPPSFSAGVQASVTFDMTNLGSALALGVWTFLLSIAAIRTGGLPKWLAYFGILVALGDLLVLFVLPIGTLVTTIWYLTMGVALLTTNVPETKMESAQ